MEMEITFPGGSRVDATFGPYTVQTDQPGQGGGEGLAPTPFATFLASLGTCAGIYVLGFCRQRGISTEGIRLVQRTQTARATGVGPGGGGAGALTRPSSPRLQPSVQKVIGYARSSGARVCCPTHRWGHRPERHRSGGMPAAGIGLAGGRNAGGWNTPHRRRGCCAAAFSLVRVSCSGLNAYGSSALGSPWFAALSVLGVILAAIYLQRDGRGG